MPSGTQKMDGLGLEVDLPKSGGIHEKQYQGRTCNYCLGQGHWKRECPVLKSNSRFYQGVRPEKPVALAVSVRAAGLDESDFRSVDPGYRSYVSQGFVSLVGSGKRVKFAGPYAVVRQISDQNYIIATPDRRKKSQLCHVNLLKPYYALPSLSNGGEKEDVKVPDDSIMQGRLRNSESLRVKIAQSGGAELG
ncbi:hypothetical protein D4764_04G0009990 [Takifugu flavidus]|uniref:Integrase p58-like C-terminal domain-containing protein n=1 Tax=Takifugu flavidus TaxID=433684 RepID=A0A5C6N4G2_9TELE|nr:hypothetical protein D4764_04G0009990 [Takifugu flavidus]